jgi:hypothetical protein
MRVTYIFAICHEYATAGHSAKGGIMLLFLKLSYCGRSKAKTCQRQHATCHNTESKISGHHVANVLLLLGRIVRFNEEEAKSLQLLYLYC